MTKKYVDGVLVDLTTEEENVRNQQITEYNANALNRALDILRQKRKPLLEETDYLALSDNTMSEEMTKYRQDLRNITNGLTTVEEVNAVVFPTKPSELYAKTQAAGTVIYSVGVSNQFGGYKIIT
jgi:hypothetical protein